MEKILNKKTVNNIIVYGLSERERIRTFDRLLRRQMLYPAELRTLVIDFRLVSKLLKSGRQDSNLRPPGPKPGAMTGLRYAPNY